MLDVSLGKDAVRIGPHFSLTFQRTLRIPDDGRTYPLPPGLGRFPVRRVADYAARVPESWREHGGVFIPMYQREAMWLHFDAPYWRPCAVQIGVGKINAISGKALEPRLSQRRQDYVVCPDQPWLDGIKAGEGFIRQFVAMPLGMGYTVEGQLTGDEEFGGLQITVFDPKPGRFPDEPPKERVIAHDMVMCCAAPGTAMGLAAGGRMRQSIYPDRHGIDTWDESNTGRVYVHIVNSLAYREITGERAPESPISARTYTQYGYPWFTLYDEERGDIALSEELAGVKSVKQMDESKGFAPQQDDDPVPVPQGQVIEIGTKKTEDIPVGPSKW